VKVRLVLLLVALAALTVAARASAGGIDDEPCPNVAGENTNTCPAGTVGTPYAIRFVEREGSGCGPGRQTFHLDAGIPPPGLNLTSDGWLTGTPEQAGRFRFYVEMLEPKNEPETCAGKETQKEFTLFVRRPVSIAGASLRSRVGARFRTTLRAEGGTGRFRWSLAEGSLPRGFTLSRSGVLRGAPRLPGAYRLTLQATDTEKRSATWTGTLFVAATVVR
jgi:large repetitive protein